MFIWISIYSVEETSVRPYYVESLRAFVKLQKMVLKLISSGTRSRKVIVVILAT